MTDDVDRRHMRRALQLAEQGWGRVHPNPMVGAVVVRDEAVVGEGFHARFGGPHGEIAALRQAGGQARGGTLYLTLEPCAHHGKTPPCTDAIIAAGIERVVFAARDPNPEAAGGAAVLEAAGIRAEGGLLEEASRRLNAAFHHVQERHAPWVSVKLAVSLDGRIARAPGERTAISGPAASAWVHHLRAGFDALLIGGRTAIVDDPMLTVRGDTRPVRAPVRVVATSRASLPPASALARTAPDPPVWVLAGRDAADGDVTALEAVGVRVLRVDSSGQGIDLGQGVTSLYRLGVRSVLCEGGGRLAGALVAAGLVQRIWLVVAPSVLGSAGVPAFPAGLEPGWKVVETRRLGGDGLLVLEPGPGSGR